MPIINTQETHDRAKLEYVLSTFHLDWDLLNTYIRDDKLDKAEQEKLTFPDNLRLYPKLAGLCLEAIEETQREYDGFAFSKRRFDLEVRKIPFAIKMATAAHTDSKLFIGTRY